MQANEVIVPITVTDDKGRFISNLSKEDFRILDEGRPQRIRFFTHVEKQPIVVGFLVDLSNNSRIHWKTYQDAILELVGTCSPAISASPATSSPTPTTPKSSRTPLGIPRRSPTRSAR